MSYARLFLSVVLLAVAYAFGDILGGSSAVLGMAAAVTPPTPTEAVKRYAPENKHLVSDIKKIIDARNKVVTAEESANKLVSMSAQAFGLEYNGPFAKWCEKNQIKHTLIDFIVHTLDASVSRKRDVYANLPIYWAVSALSQQYKASLKVAEREKKVETKVLELVASGMAVEVAKAQAEEAIPQVGLGQRGTGDQTDETPLKRYQKAFGSIVAALSDTPRDLATSILTSVKLSEDSIKSFCDNILSKQTGHPAVKVAVEASFSKWLTVERAIGFLERSGYTVIAKVAPPTVSEMAAHGPKLRKSLAKRKVNGRKALGAVVAIGGLFAAIAPFIVS